MTIVVTGTFNEYLQHALVEKKETTKEKRKMSVPSGWKQQQQQHLVWNYG